MPVTLALPARAILAATLLVASAASDASLLVTERWREITAGSQAERRGFATADFDDDGRTDLAVAANGPAIILRIDGVGAGGWLTKQTLVVQTPTPSPYTGEVPVAWTVPGPDRLILLTNAGEAIEFSGWPLRETRRFAISSSASSGAIGDVDADGVDELVVTAGSTVAAYSLQTGAQEWSAPYQAAEVKLAQLDADAALEVLLARTPGVVLDGATRAVDWSYPDGFGAYLAVGRFGADAAAWFAGARDWGNVLVMRASPWSPVWDFQNFDNDALAACDAGGDAREEIIVGDGQWGDVLVIDSDTHQPRRTIPHAEHGTTALATADFDGDGDCDIAFSGSSSYGASWLYHVYDAASGTVLHEPTNFTGALEALAIADLDGNGTRELVLATATEPTRLRVTDLATGRLLWELAGSGGNANDAFYLKTRRVLVAQLDADAALEIVLAGTALYDGRVTVVDSGTREVQRQIGTYSAGPMRSREVSDAAILDFDRDGVQDIVVATQAATSGANGARLHVFSLQSGATLWESVAMGTGFADMKGVLVAQSDDDPAAEVIAVLHDGLRAYDADTRLLDWSFTYPAEISAFAIDPVAQELVLANGIVANFYALSTRQSLRSANLGGAVTGLAWLPGPDRRYVARAGEQLVALDGLAGTVLDRSEWLGPTQPGTLPAVAAVGTGWQVASSGTLGYFLHAIAPDPMTVFADGFEP